MIGQYLLNTNESVVLFILQKNLEVHQAKGTKVVGLVGPRRTSGLV